MHEALFSDVAAGYVLGLTLWFAAEGLSAMVRSFRIVADAER
jgi:hypothetical protein